jgi:hypothetical protein
MGSLQQGTVDGYKPVFAPKMNDLQTKSAERNVLHSKKLTLHDGLKIIQASIRT